MPPRSAASPALWPTRIRRPPRGRCGARSSSIPSDAEAHLLLAELAIDEDKKDEAREAIAKALAINPKSLEASRSTAAIEFVEGRDAEHQAAIAAALAINPLFGEAYRIVGAITARNYRFDEAAEQMRRGDRHRSRERPRPCRPRRPPAAHRRRAQRAAGAGDGVSSRPVRRSSPTTCSDDGHARQVRDRPGRRPHDPAAQGRGRRDARVRAGARAGGAGHAVQALRVHAGRADPHRDLPEARRLRGPQRRPARHDRRARRLLRPRGHDGFAEGAAARASSSGERRCGTRWRTSSRCRCRTSGCRAG